ncbi:MAG: hypothetical protein WC959_05425 [Kiritimatiellales bacterium]
MMCDIAAIFHTSFDEMECWDVDTLTVRLKHAHKIAKAMYGMK